MENLKQVDYKKGFNSPYMRKIIFLFIFVIMLLIPLSLIRSLIYERSSLYNQTVTEIGNEWGKSQKIIAPVISLAYVETAIDSNTNKTVSVEKRLAVLPNELKATIELRDEIRKRGIYNATVYNANMKLEGYFLSKDLPNKNIKAYVSVGLSDTRALLKINKFKLGDVEKDLEPMSGTMTNPLFSRGISGELSSEYDSSFTKDKIPFEIDIDFRGSKEISILPLGRKNHFEIKSSWKSPSFLGILPIERTIDENGFSAVWNISNLVRSYPQVIVLNKDYTLADFRQEEYYYNQYGDYDSSENTVVRVNLFNSVTNYTQIIRACKYGILFIMMSLAIVYIFEIVSKKAAHYVQYGVVGFSLVIFYLLLLSLSEFLGFEYSYLISSLAIVLPNSLYITSMTSNKKFGLAMFVFLSAIYAILFSILRMEQFALLTGSLLILGVLYVIMYLTKNADIFLELEKE